MVVDRNAMGGREGGDAPDADVGAGGVRAAGETTRAGEDDGGVDARLGVGVFVQYNDTETNDARGHDESDSSLRLIFRFLDALEGDAGDSLNADGHEPSRARGHSWHFGRSGVHVSWPKPTSKGLISIHSSLGSQLSSAARVSSGVFFRGDPFFPSTCSGTQPRRSEMRWTCTSTQIPVGSPQPTFMTRYAIRPDARERAQRLHARRNVPAVLFQ